MTNAAPGWYPNGDEWETYWDGMQWTAQNRPRGATQDAVAPADAPLEADLHTGDGRDRPLLDFVSHISGKNARVFVWPDRVEWDRKGLLSTGAKAGLAVATVGLSYLATGLTRKQSTEMIPIKSITSVTAKKGMGFQTTLHIITAGNTIDMRIAHREAEQVRTVLMQLINGSHPAQAAPATSAVPQTAPATASAPADIAGQIAQLAALRDAGILTDDEFTTKKTQLLERM